LAKQPYLLQAITFDSGSNALCVERDGAQAISNKAIEREAKAACSF
jgi:hypothetical protein